jgi:hypothetical protein
MAEVLHRYDEPVVAAEGIDDRAQVATNHCRCPVAAAEAAAVVDRVRSRAAEEPPGGTGSAG